MPDDMLAVIERTFAPVANPPSSFDKNYFQAVLKMEPNPWVLANADTSGLTAEFAFEGTTPAVGLHVASAETSVQTTLLQASTEEEHPRLGSGLLLRMTLPVAFNLEQAIAKAQELNQAETQEHTLSYFMGSWCSASLIEDTSAGKKQIDTIARIIAHEMKRPEGISEIAELIAQAAQKMNWV